MSHTQRIRDQVQRIALIEAYIANQHRLFLTRRFELQDINQSYKPHSKAWMEVKTMIQDELNKKDLFVIESDAMLAGLHAKLELMQLQQQ